MSDGDTQIYGLAIEIPVHAVPQHGLAVVSYFDAKGDTQYAVTLEGDSTLSNILGLLEMVKARILKEAEEW